MSLVHLAFAMAAFGTACLIACAYGLWRISRDEKRQQLKQQRIDEINARLRRVPAAPDNTEGLRLDWHDECERLWKASGGSDTGLDQLFTQLGQPRKEEQ